MRITQQKQAAPGVVGELAAELAFELAIDVDGELAAELAIDVDGELAAELKGDSKLSQPWVFRC